MYLLGRAGPPIIVAQFRLWAAASAAGSSLHKSLVLLPDLCVGRNGKCLQSGAAHQQTSTDVPVGAYLGCMDVAKITAWFNLSWSVGWDPDCDSVSSAFQPDFGGQRF